MIRATSLVRRFGSVTALAGVDLAVQPGELFALIGPDGAGKSTFFRLVAGLLAPTSGTIERDPGGTFGLVPQRFSLYEDLTVDENLRLRARLYDVPDAEAVRRVAAAAGRGAPDDSYRAGDEIRLMYGDGTQVTAIGEQVTIQARSPRLFFRVANWLHYNRGKKAWTYVADVYAVMLLYLAISGLFMIKGKLGLKWRGAVLVGLGIAVPLAYVILSGGPEAHRGEQPVKIEATSE